MQRCVILILQQQFSEYCPISVLSKSDQCLTALNSYLWLYKCGKSESESSYCAVLYYEDEILHYTQYKSHYSYTVFLHFIEFTFESNYECTALY